MRLFIDLDTRGFIESDAFPRPVTELALKRGDNVPVELRFVRDGTIVELASGATGRIGLKPQGQFGSAFYLALDAEWEKTGAGETSSYAFSLNLATTEIESAFLAEPASVLAMLEVEWVESGLRTSSATLPVEIENDVNQGDEGVPTTATPPYPLPQAIFTTADLVQGEVPVSAAEIDLDISAAELSVPPTTVLPFGIKKPDPASDNIGILCVSAIDAQTLRAHLTAAPTEPGYIATLLFKS